MTLEEYFGVSGDNVCTGARLVFEQKGPQDWLLDDVKRWPGWDDSLFSFPVEHKEENPLLHFGEAVCWIMENVKGRWQSPYGKVFYFEEEKEAALFKLRFG